MATVLTTVRMAKSILIKRKPIRESPIVRRTTQTRHLVAEVARRRALKLPAVLVPPKEAPAVLLAKA